MMFLCTRIHFTFIYIYMIFTFTWRINFIIIDYIYLYTFIQYTRFMHLFVTKGYTIESNFYKFTIWINNVYI